MLLSIASSYLSLRPWRCLLPGVDFDNPGSIVTRFFVEIDESVNRLGVGTQNEDVRRVVLVVALPPAYAIDPRPRVVGLVYGPEPRHFLAVLPSHGSAP